MKYVFILLSMMSNLHAAFPKPWQIGFQSPAAPLMTAINDMHNLLLVIISLIAILVISLMGWVFYRFREKKNPVASQRSHHTLLEVIWTIVPILVVIMIAVPSIKILYVFDKAENPDITVKVIGHQWYWSYEYLDQQCGDITFDSYMIEEKDLKPGQLRLLEVDNRVVVPVGKTVRLLVTSADVLHSFAVPSFGIKRDAVPGRVNETWFRCDQEGVYYGQCSELCGVKHGFMPIAIDVVSDAKYQEWLQLKRKK
jgi:cytochrome c oxidase subunit 2